MTAEAMVELEEQRDFLLRSLDDLERERAAGDIEVADYETLHDDYTARAAAVLRTIEAGRPAPMSAPPPRRRWLRTGLVTVGITALAVTAGVAVSTSAGSRLPGETITGDIRETRAAQLQQAAVLASQQQYREALDIYDEVLTADPANVEALSERGLLLVTLSQAAELPNLAGEGRRSVEEALRLEPDNPRSLFYLALALRIEDDDAGSQDAIERALAADPPPLLRQQIEGFLATAGEG